MHLASGLRALHSANRSVLSGCFTETDRKRHFKLRAREDKVFCCQEVSLDLILPSFTFHISHIHTLLFPRLCASLPPPIFCFTFCHFLLLYSRCVHVCALTLGTFVSPWKKTATGNADRFFSSSRLLFLSLSRKLLLFHCCSGVFLL